MKHIFILFLLILNSSINLGAQGTLLSKSEIKIYRTWITFENRNYLTDGFLYRVTDTSIVISSSPNRKSYIRGNFDTLAFDLNSIVKIRVRRNRAPLRGMLIAGAGGAILGSMLGYLDGDDPSYYIWGLSAEKKAVLGGIGLSLLGGGIGLLIGTIKMTIPLNGKQGEKGADANKLKSYAILK